MKPEQKLQVPLRSYHLGGAAVDLLGDDEHRHDEVAPLLPLPLLGLPLLSPVDGAGTRWGLHLECRN